MQSFGRSHIEHQITIEQIAFKVLLSSFSVYTCEAVDFEGFKRGTRESIERRRKERERERERESEGGSEESTRGL